MPTLPDRPRPDSTALGFDVPVPSAPPRSSGERPGGVAGWIDERACLPLADGRTLRAADGPAAWLEALREARPATWLRRIEGRETFAWPGAEADLVVKRYCGDEPRDRWYELLRARAPGSPGGREGRNLAALAAIGVPVPRVLAWFEASGVAGSAVVMERLPRSEHLRSALTATRADEESAAARRAWAGELCELTARLHAAGWYHRDLYLVHVVPTPRLVLLDVARARREVRPRRRWFVKDLAALAVSTPEWIGRRERLRFLRDYLRRRELLRRGALRRWARAIEAKAHRLGRHAPRRVDPRDGDERYGSRA